MFTAPVGRWWSATGPTPHCPPLWLTCEYSNNSVLNMPFFIFCISYASASEGLLILKRQTAFPSSSQQLDGKELACQVTFSWQTTSAEPTPPDACFVELSLSFALPHSALHPSGHASDTQGRPSCCCSHSN